MDSKGYLADVIAEFRRTKVLAERAMEQVTDEDFLATPDPHTNPIAVIVKHVAGNQRSRWTDFLATDGEKPDRQRDTEFDLGAADTRAALMERWERGWGTLLATLEALGPADLDRSVTIRAEPHTVPQAIHRQLTHYAYHAGQIVQLARHWSGPRWRTLSVPKGASAAFNVKPTSYLGKRAR